MTIQTKRTSLSIIACLLFFANFSFGQSMPADTAKTPHKQLKNEIALDASYIFRNIPATFSPQADQISLTYKRHFGKLAVRALFTPSIYVNANKYNQNDTVPKDWVKQRNANFNFDIRLGIQSRCRLNRFISFYYGVDAILDLGHSYNIAETSNQNSFSNYTYLQRSDGNQVSKGYGLAPLIGIQVFLTRRFAISLENYFTAVHTDYNSSYGSLSKTVDENGNTVPGTEYKSHNTSTTNINTFMNSQNKVYSLNMSVFF